MGMEKIEFFWYLKKIGWLAILGFLAGFIQLGFGFILITIGARSTPAAFVGIIMLTEAVLGPLWAWFFINENPPFIVLIGGSVVIIAVLLQFLSSIDLKKFYSK